MACFERLIFRAVTMIYYRFTLSTVKKSDKWDEVSGVKRNIVLLFLPLLFPEGLAANNAVHNISHQLHKKVPQHRVLLHTILPLRGLPSVARRKDPCRIYSDGNFLHE